MPDDQTRLDRVFALQDVEVGTADGSQGYADDHFTRSGFRDGHGFQTDLSSPVKHQGLHGRGVAILFCEEGVRALRHGLSPSELTYTSCCGRRPMMTVTSGCDRRHSRSRVISEVED